MGAKVKPWHQRQQRNCGDGDRNEKRISPLRNGNRQRIAPLRVRDYEEAVDCYEEDEGDNER